MRAHRLQDRLALQISCPASPPMPEDSISIDLSLNPTGEAPARESLVGAVMGGFRLTRLLGTGGMGSVYLGEHQMIGSKVAVKVLHRELSANPSQVERFLAEARAVNLIDHENIVRIFDLATDPQGRHYFVMEYLEGKPLTALTKLALPAAEAIPLLIQVLGALSAAHARGVVHRDLKPDNIFLVRRGGDDRFVKVLDFGVAKLLSEGPVTGQTQMGMAIGTPTYMSPEQWSGQAVDGRADIYAMGVLSYLLATGRMPFPRGSLLEMLAYHREKVPDAPNSVNQSVPRAWSDAILRALEKRPKDRFQTADQMAAALLAVLDRTSEEPLAAAGVAPRIAPVSVGEMATRLTPVPAMPRYTPVASAVAGGTPVPARATPLGSGVGISPYTPLPHPKTAVTPAPAEQRYATRMSVQLPARILDAQEVHQFDAICTELSRGGLYVCHTGAAPAVFTRLKVVLVVNGQLLECPAEVVRQVSPQDAERWQMSPGFAVQFLQPTAELKETITQILKSVAAIHPGTGIASRLQKIAASDFYSVLELPADATGPQIRQKAEELLEQLRSAEKDAPSDQVRRHLAEARQKVEIARSILADPARRVDHDLAKKNFRGVARCLEAGLPVETLQALHQRYAQANAYDVNSARLLAISAGVWEKRGDREQARAQYEAALKLDPANPTLHQGLAALGDSGAGKRIA